MKLKEAIDIGRTCGCTTIEQVDDLIAHLFNNCNVISEESIIEYIDDYEQWARLYHSEFPNLKFLDLKI